MYPWNHNIITNDYLAHYDGRYLDRAMWGTVDGHTHEYTGFRKSDACERGQSENSVFGKLMVNYSIICSQIYSSFMRSACIVHSCHRINAEIQSHQTLENDFWIWRSECICDLALLRNVPMVFKMVIVQYEIGKYSFYLFFCLHSAVQQQLNECWNAKLLQRNRRS